MTDPDKVLRIARAMGIPTRTDGGIIVRPVNVTFSPLGDSANGNETVRGIETLFDPLNGGADGAAMLDWLRERGDVSLSTEGGKAFCLFEPFTDADDDWTERSADDDWHAIGEAVIAVVGEE